MKQAKWIINKIEVFLFTSLLFCSFFKSYSQNSLTGDGFGGRSWYVAHNYQVGAYTAYTVCGANNQLYGWGGNDHGELGNGTQIPSLVPVPIPGMTDVKFYSTGYVSSVIKSDNGAWVWGSPDYAGLSPNPTYMLPDVKFVDGGISHAVFVKNDGTVWGVGMNYYGELGNGTTSNITTHTPVQMVGVSNAVRAVALGYYQHPSASIILLADGTVKITGGYEWFSQTNNTTPVTIPGLSNIIDIKGGSTAAFALNSIGEVYSFGREIAGFQFGSLGLGTTNPGLYSYTAPTKLIFPIGAAPIVALSANNDGLFAFALDENGKVYGWGDNRIGQLGDGTYNNKTTPELITTNSIDIFAGEIFTYILKADSSLWATGASSSYWTYNTGSIWMDQINIGRNVLTQIHPTIAPMNLCGPKPYGVIPIQLLNFSCKANGSTANLKWTSAEEINFSKYILEYSQNGIKFQEIASISAKGSNSTYNYDHKNVSGIAYYRLKMVDNDRNFKYSEIRITKFSSFINFTIAPNPSKDYIYIYMKKDAVIKSVNILSLDGRIMKTISDFHIGQPISIINIPNGTYILKTFDNKEEIEYGKFIKF